MHHNTFDKALKFTLQWEGGYVNHPDDPGGPTNCGITQKTYDEYIIKNNLPSKKVKDLSIDEIKDLYRILFWDRIEKWGLPEKLAIAAFDFAVHSGHLKSLKELQKCIGTVADGIYGPITSGYIKVIEDVQRVIDCYIARRKHFLIQIGKGNNRVFLHGWMNRIRGLKEFLA